MRGSKTKWAEVNWTTRTDLRSTTAHPHLVADPAIFHRCQFTSWDRPVFSSLKKEFEQFGDRNEPSIERCQTSHQPLEHWIYASFRGKPAGKVGVHDTD